ncbi:HAD-like domain-containing protein [Obelidium mucronatum]|nr:HAD-like domain-containing protein [Obelidium mucronatum]
MMFTLLALDLDGTLLTSTGQITPRLAAALKRVRDTGAHIALCTGRAALTTVGVEAKLGFSVHCICYNGAVGFGPIENSKEIEGRMIHFKHVLTTTQVNQILDAADKCDLVVNYHQHGYSAIRVMAKTEDHRRRVERFRSSVAVGVPFEFHDDLRLVAEPPVKMLLLTKSPHEGFEYLQATVDGITVYKENSFLDCIPNFVNKAVGVKKLCEVLGCQIQETVCFGDGHNDIEFVTHAGLGFAMANGVPELKAVAKKVTRFTNNEDGVAIELEDLLAQGLFGPPVE